MLAGRRCRCGRGRCWRRRGRACARGASPADAPSMKRGFGTQWWIQRPSAHRKRPFGARASQIQLSKFCAFGVLGALPRRRASQASTPCSSEVATCCPRPGELARAERGADAERWRGSTRRGSASATPGNSGPGPRRALHVRRASLEVGEADPAAAPCGRSCRPASRAAPTGGRCARRRARRSAGRSACARSSP